MRLDPGALLSARTLLIVLAGALALTAPLLPVAAAEAEFVIEMKDHKFSPAEIRVPAATRIKLTVKNLDAGAEEFESHPLGIEKVIAGNASATIRLKPLDKGSYAFIGEYHEDTAKGTLIAE
jgi:plastocyanin